MAKLKSPLLSFSASGSLAGALTFLNIRGASYVKSKQGPIGGTSPAQILQRAKFKAASVHSHLLTDEQKLYWHNVNEFSGACPWLVNFMSAYLVDPGQFEVTMIKSIQHSTVTIPINNVVGTVEIDEVDVSKTVLIHLGNKWHHYWLDQFMTSIELVNSTTVDARVLTSNEDNDILIKFIALEFDSAAVKSRQFLAGIFPPLDASLIVEIDEVVPAKTILMPAGARCATTRYQWFGEASCELIDSTHVECLRGAGDIGFMVYFTVLEFN